MSDPLRGGRLSQTREDITAYTSSIKSDVMLFKSVVRINQAHVIMLMEQGIIPRKEGTLILKALKEVRMFEAEPQVEDIHMYVEKEVFKATDERVAGNLHIAKSRNDQVSAAIRMVLRQELIQLVESITTLQHGILQKADQHVDTVFPGYTHLQPAQPITLAHYLLSCFDVLERDLQRIKEAYKRVNKSPMGACALATTSFPISREKVADLLGFDGIIVNSIDAVGSRDFLLEQLAVLTVLAVDLSRMVEDLILWSSEEFGLIELPEEFSSTSSIMPQKKNPDVLEVIRARMSRVQGCFQTAASILQALPSSYNMDLQEATPELWKALEEVEDAVTALSDIYPALNLKEFSFEKPGHAFMTSTELANILVRKYGVPFRTAHKAVGALIRHLLEKQTIRGISVDLLEAFLEKVSGLSLKIAPEDIEEAMDPKRFVESHDVRGGPAPREVRRLLKARRGRLSSSKNWVDNIRARLSQAEDVLEWKLEAYKSS